MSRGSKHVKVHISWKHTCGSICMKGICMKGIRVIQKTCVLTRRNLPTKYIALHYINILLVDQHNVTYGLFSSAHIKCWWISSGVRKFRVKYTIVFCIKLMCLVANIKQSYCLVHCMSWTNKEMASGCSVRTVRYVCLFGSFLTHEPQHERCVVCLMLVIITSGYTH